MVCYLFCYRRYPLYLLVFLLFSNILLQSYKIFGEIEYRYGKVGKRQKVKRCEKYDILTNRRQTKTGHLQYYQLQSVRRLEKCYLFN
jgi:hypothetical protein